MLDPSLILKCLFFNLFFYLILMLLLLSCCCCFPAVAPRIFFFQSLVFLRQQFVRYSQVEVALYYLYLIEVLTDRLKVYTIHTECQSYRFNLIKSTLCTTLTFLLLQFVFAFVCVCDWCECVYKCVWYHNTFLVHLSLGNEVVLYWIVSDFQF